MNGSLKHSELTFQLIVESAPNALILVNKEGKIAFVNSYAEKLFGFNRSELIGQSIEIIIPTEDETIEKSSADYFGPELARPYLEQDQHILKSGTPVMNAEETTLSESGERIHLLTTKIPLRDKDNTIIGLVGISHDVTRQKQIELDLRESKYFLERAQEVGNIGSWVYDINKGAMALSKEPIRIFGLSKEDTVVPADTLANMIHPDDQEKTREMARLTMEDTQPFVLDHRIVLNDGLTRWVHVRGNVTRDDKGKPLLFVGVTQDITERKMAEERFRLVVESTPNAMALVNN